MRNIVHIHGHTHNSLSLFIYFFRKIDGTQVILTRSSPRWRLSWHQRINSSLWIWTKMNSKASPTPTLSLSFRFNTKLQLIAPYRCESRTRSYYPESIILSLCHLDCPLSSPKQAQTQQVHTEPNQDYTQSQPRPQKLWNAFPRGERTVIKECIHSLHENVLSFHLHENYPTSFFYTFSP